MKKRVVCTCLLLFFPFVVWAQDLALMDAINAVLMGNPTPRQEALVIYHNREINQLAIRGRISDSAYQASQKYFTTVNNSVIRDSAGAGGLSVKLQPSAGGKHNPGTDTDVLAESAQPGRKLKLADIKAADDAYQENLRRLLKRKGFDAPPGRINTETDFMPVRGSVTDDEFTNINNYINSRRGTAYTRPGAADIEFLMRTARNNPNIKFNLFDTNEYVLQMQELAHHKLRDADLMEIKAKQFMKSNPAAAESYLADAQLLRSQGAKYLQRIENLTNAIAEQNGLPKIEIPRNSLGQLSPDSLDEAVQHIEKLKRGVSTADDAALVGELGGLGVGKGVSNYVKKLAAIAARQPSQLEAVQAIIAEQAASLPPSMREVLLRRAAAAYGDAGGTPYGRVSFLRKLINLAEDPVARASVKAKLSAGAAALPYQLPASVQSAARVTGVVGGVMTVAMLYLDYEACILSGKPKSVCESQLKHTASVSVIVGGTLFLSAHGLIALGALSPATLAVVGPILSLAGVPLMLYAGYAAANNWATAEEQTALIRQYAMEKDFLMRFQQSAAVAQAELNLMLILRSNVLVLCMQLQNKGRATKLLMQTSKQFEAQWQAAIGEKLEASRSCDDQRDYLGRILELGKQTRENETKAIAQLDEANVLGEKCSTIEQANRIRLLMENSQQLSARMMADAAQARGYNNELGHENEAEIAQRLKASEASRERVDANRHHINTLMVEMRQLQGELHEYIDAYAKARAGFVTHFGLMSQAHPTKAPSPLYQIEFMQANALQEKLKTQFAELQEVLECHAGDSEATAALTLSLEADRVYDGLDERHRQLRDETKTCTGIEKQDKLVEDMAASANWVQAAMEINSPLLKKAEACRRKGKSGGAVSQCGTNQQAEWNVESQKYDCQCLANFVPAENKKSCVPKKEPVVIACNSTTKAGTNPPQTIIVNVGRNAGVAQFRYEMFKVPDHMQVQYGGQVVADTGCVSGSQTLPLQLNGSSEQVTIVVQPACQKSESTEWNFTLSCPSQDQAAINTSNTSNTSIASNTPGATHAGSSQMRLHSVSGQAYITQGQNAAQALRINTHLTHGAQLQTGADGRIEIKTPNQMRLSMGQNTQLRLGEPNADKQWVHLDRGSLDIVRDPINTARDDVLVSVGKGTVQALDTRYRMVRDARGTEVFVYEGSVRLTGDYIIRTYAYNVERGKPSPVKELVLRAGESALIADVNFSSAATANQGAATTSAAVPPSVTTRVNQIEDDRLSDDVLADLTGARTNAIKPPVTSPATSPMPTPSSAQATGQGRLPSPSPNQEPWNDPRIQSLIDQWLSSATPLIAATRPGSFSYSEWGQVKGPGITIAGAPEHPAGWSRYQSMWAVRMKFDSLNLCTMGEFIERQIAGKSMAGCQKPVNPSTPSPAPTQAANPVVRSESNGLNVPVRRSDEFVTPDFSGEWACEIREGNDSSALYPTITRTGNTYKVETLTSGVEGMIPAYSVRIEAGKLIAVHKFQYTEGTMTISLQKSGSRLSGTYYAVRAGYPTETHPITQCELESNLRSSSNSTTAAPAPVQNTPKLMGLLTQIANVTDEHWAGGQSLKGIGEKYVLALVAEVNDRRTQACADEAKRRNWQVVGFTSRLSLQHAQYPNVPNFPLIIGTKARSLIYTIHMDAGRKDVPIPFATAYLIDTQGRVTQNGICFQMMNLDVGVSDGKK